MPGQHGIPVHTISFEEDRMSFACRPDQPVLLAMCATGGGCIPVGCRSGGCGVCRVQVLQGSYQTGTMSKAHISEAQRDDGEVLSCQLLPRSDLMLRVLGPRAPAKESPYQKIFEKLRTHQAALENGVLKHEPQRTSPVFDSLNKTFK